MIGQYSKYFNASPDSLGTEDIRKYLLHLKNDKGQATKTLYACRAVLRIQHSTQTANVEQWKQTLLRLTGIDVDQSPCCSSGKMESVGEIRPAFCRGPRVGSDENKIGMIVPWKTTWRW